MPCASKDTVELTIVKIASVNSGLDQVVCSTTSEITLSGLISGGTTTGTWSTNGKGDFYPNNTSLNTTYRINSADITIGVVSFFLTSTNNGICSAVTDTMELNILKMPSAFVPSDTSMCSGDGSIQLTGVVRGSSNAVLWFSDGTGTFVPDNHSMIVKYIPSSSDIAKGAVLIRFIAGDNYPCSNDTSTMLLSIYTSPFANFTASKYVATIPNDPISFNNSSLNANSYYWDFGDGNSTSEINPIHDYSKAGEYTIILIAESNNGCKDTTFKEITLYGKIIVPTAFTPGRNDHGNAMFVPYAAGVVEFHMMIFNRWGELILKPLTLLQDGMVITEVSYVNRILMHGK